MCKGLDLHMNPASQSPCKVSKPDRKPVSLNMQFYDPVGFAIGVIRDAPRLPEIS
jgi:hypothetical protein